MTRHRNPTRNRSSDSDQPRRRFRSGTLLWAAGPIRFHTPHLQRVPRWITWFALCVAFGFLGWIIYLSTGIRSIVTTQHYDIAWLGFDVLEVSMVAVVAVAAWKHHRSTTIFTGICAVMFAVDGWFDVWTSPRGSVLGAALLAVCLEVPLIAIFTVATIHGERAKNNAGAVAEARACRTRCTRQMRAPAVSLSTGPTTPVPVGRNGRGACFSAPPHQRLRPGASRPSGSHLKDGDTYNIYESDGKTIIGVVSIGHGN